MPEDHWWIWRGGINSMRFPRENRPGAIGRLLAPLAPLAPLDWRHWRHWRHSMAPIMPNGSWSHTTLLPHFPIHQNYDVVL